MSRWAPRSTELQKAPRGTWSNSRKDHPSNSKTAFGKLFFSHARNSLIRTFLRLYSGKIFHKAVRRNYISGRMTFTGSKKNKSYWPRNKRTVFLYSRQFKFFMHYALRDMDRVPWTDLVFIPGNMYVLDYRTIASTSNDWLIHIFLSILKCHLLGMFSSVLFGE